MQQLHLTLAFSAILGVVAANHSDGSEAVGEQLVSQAAASDTRTSLAEGLPEPVKPITSLGTNIAPQDGRLPTDYAKQSLSSERVMAPEHADDGVWAGVEWVAPGTCHRPLYFENPSLERHGYSLGLAQPFASAAHFVGNAAIFPYRFVAEPTCDCVYTLGHERPGTPTPLRYYRPRFSLAGGVAQAGTITGLIFLLP